MSIPVEDVQRGDILLVTRRPGSALADLIVELDGSPQDFSHSGIAGGVDEKGEGTIISSYPSFDGLLPPDIGGLHHDHFSHFWDLGQDIHRLRLPEDVDRDVALTRLDRYPADRESSFATAKIVMVAAALHALVNQDSVGEEGVEEILTAAVNAGNSWASETDFFCAEFAAYVYAIPFTVGDLRARTTRRGARELLTKAIVELGFQALVLNKSEDQKQTLGALVDAVQQHDPAFFEENIKVVFEDLSPFRQRRERSSPDTPLPFALATPAMLETWGGDTDLIERPG